MKKKFSSMGRVAIALVLALSLCLMTAVPVAAAVTEASVSLTDHVITSPSGYDISFKTTSTLAAGDKIFITFPDDTTVPLAYETGEVTVEGVEISEGDISASGRTVTIRLPYAISALTIVDVVFTLDADIENPSTSDYYQLEVSTSQETTQVPSAKYAIIAAPTVTSVTPLVGEQGAEELEVTINGTNLIEITDVSFGDGIEVDGFTNGVGETESSPDSMTATISIAVDAEEGTRNVSVTNAVDTGTGTELFTVEAPPAPVIDSVAGTAYQQGNDTILITFNSPVGPTDLTWHANDFSSVKCGEATLTLSDAVFTPVEPVVGFAATLIITLNEAGGEYLVKDATLTVIPAFEAIVDAVGQFVPTDPVTGSVSGDSLAPTVALTYSPDRSVRDDDTLVITAIFSEDMAATPTITISGELVTAEDMLGSAKVWTYDFNVPDEIDGTYAVTIVGTDLAGNTNQAATNDTFVIDNTVPTILEDNIVGTTILGAGDTIKITFLEPVTATWENAFASILCGETTLTLPDTAGAYVYDTSADTLTITLDEATDGDYLINTEFLTVTPEEAAIKDAALNAMATDAVVGTVAVSGDLDAPAITKILGVGTNTIRITFSEAVLAADMEWSANEFTIESPDTAPLNINHAIFTPNDDPGTGMATVLTIILNTDKDGASLVAGVAILVTPDTEAIVDLAGNDFTSGEVSSGAHAGWLEVWVDDDADEDWYVDDPTHFDDIQLAIDAVAEGGTVNVAAGIYEPAPALEINKAGLTLLSTDGAAVTTLNDAQIQIKADDVTVDGFTVHNDPYPGYGIWVAVPTQGAKILDNILIGIANSAIVLQKGQFITGTTISGNLIEDCGCGIMVGATSKNNMIFNNTIRRVGGGIGLFSGSEENPTEGNSIIGNAITDSSSGISILDYYGPGKFLDDNLIEGNTISGNAGKAIEIEASLEITDLTIINNNITGNGFGIENLTDVEINATNNWWGTAVESAIVGMVSGFVDYSPWLNAPYPDGEPTTTDCSTIDLKSGWNLISLPLIPTSSTITDVLAGITDGTVEQVRTYAQGIWPSWARTGDPPVNPLSDMKDGVGFWVQMSAEGALVVTGYEICKPAPDVPPAYDVVPGWNLIGFKFTEVGDVATYLGSVVFTDLQAIYGYDASVSAYFIPGVKGAEEHKGLEAGYGYWIALTKEGIIYPTLELPEPEPPA